MPAFSQKSLDKLATCHPKLQSVANKVIERFDCTVVTGHRSGKDQDEMFRTGLSRVKYPHSKHNRRPSDAMDLAPYKTGFGIDWGDTHLFYLFAGYVLATAHSLGVELRWGGSWDGDWDLHDQRFNDLIHFELKE